MSLERVAVLCEPAILRWQVDALERVVREAGAEITLVVVDASSDLSETANSSARGLRLGGLRRFVDGIVDGDAWRLVQAEQKLAWILGGPSRRWHLEQRVQTDSVDCLREAEFIRTTALRDGQWQELPDDVIEDIGKKADVVVRFAFGLLRGDVLDCTEYGVLSFHPADVRKRRGLGPEIAFLEGDDRVGITLQRLTTTIDGGEIVLIDSVEISDAHSLDTVLGRMKARQSEMLAEGIARLQDPSFSPSPPESLGEYFPIEYRNRYGVVLKIVGKSVLGRLRRALRRAVST